MTTEKFTPGPWRTDDQFPAVVVADGRGDTIDGPVRAAVAECLPTDKYDHDGRRWTCGGDANANARLVAAAPDLLAACRRVLGAVADGRADCNGMVVAVVRMAVDKATEGTR